MSLDLRPLTLGELLDRSFGLYRRHFWLFVGIMAVPSVFTLMIGVGTQFLPEAGAPAAFAAAEPDPSTIAVVVAAAVAGFVVIFIAYWIAYMVALGATTAAVSELYVGRPATIATAYARMRGQIGRLMLLVIAIAARLLALFVGLMVIIALLSLIASLALAPLGALLMVLGTVVAMLACMMYSLRYAISVPALVLEHRTAGDSIRRSIELTRGSLGRTAVITIFAIVITYAAMMLFHGPFFVGAVLSGPESAGAFWFGLAGTFSSSIGSAITAPLMIVAFALLYYDLRIRKEGLDIELMVAGLEAQASAPADVRPVSAPS